MAAEGNMIHYMITGEESRDDIPENATHVSVHPSVTEIPARLFFYHPNIIELICHDGVIKIEEGAFRACPRLKRVIMKGVENVESEAFKYCDALEYVECDKLERIGRESFYWCKSIVSINLPSAKTVSNGAFYTCPALLDAKFGHNLESIEGDDVFYNCRSLQRITIPLKYGLFDNDDIFRNCENLMHVDLVDEEALRETIDALLWEEWKNDVNAELISIVQILPNAYAGNYNNEGEKAAVLRRWITNVLNKIIYYKSQHRRLLNEAESRLQLVLPHDIVMNNVVPFFTLPQHKFDGEGEIYESNCSDEYSDGSYSFRADSDVEEDDHDGGEGGDSETGGERKHEEFNDEERRKRQRTENNGDVVEGENDL